MKKPAVLVIALIILFGLFIYFYLRSVDYELEYTIDDIKVLEKYDKDLSTYYFEVTYKDKTYELVSLAKYNSKRKLIDNIKVDESDTSTCLSFEGKIDLYSICSDEEGYYVSDISSTADFKSQDSYKNISIGNIDDKTYLLWNYHDFIYLNSDKKDTIKLFSKDIYNLSLIYDFSNYLLLPDYEQDYIFDKMYLINTDKGKISTIDLRFDVYFNSYFLGDDDNKVYLYDLKENQEFYIDLDKEEIYKTTSELLVDNEWISKSKQEFQKEKPTFTHSKNIDFYIEDNTLYMQRNSGKMPLKISNRNVSELVKTEDLAVYYISEDILYKYDLFSGETALLKYSEWNFNHQNMVFIFD